MICSQVKLNTCNCTKLVLRALISITICFPLLFYFLYSKPVPIEYVLVIAICVSLLLSILVTFNLRMRCSLTLCLPQLTSREGNAFLYSVITGLLLTGPLTNITYNVNQTSKSATCLAELSKAHLDQFGDVQRELVRLTTDALQSWIAISRAIDSVVGPIGQAFEQAHNGIQKAFTDIKTAADACSQVLLNTNRDCKNALGKVENLPKQGINAAKDGFDKVKDGFDDFKNKIPFIGRRRRSLSNVCDVINDNSCKVIDVGKITIEFIPRTIDLIDQFREMFSLTINTEHSVSANYNISKNGTEIIESITQEFNEKFDKIRYIISIIQLLFLSPLIIMVIRTYLWLGKYEKKPEDVIKKAKSKKKGRKPGLTLKIALIGCHVLMAVTLFGFDYTLYWVQTVVNKHMDVTAEISSGYRLAIGYKAGKVFEPIVDQFISRMDLIGEYKTKVISDQCLPKPNEPDFMQLIPIAFLYLCNFLVILLEPHLSHLQDKIIDYYYPLLKNNRIDPAHIEFLRNERKSGNVQILKAKLEKQTKN